MNIDIVLDDFLLEENLPKEYKELAQQWFIPLANAISKHHEGAKKTILIGLNGCQGSGKSTLSSLLTKLLTQVYNKPTIALSIDDFYYSHQFRCSLAETIHPLLQTRGVPGTHNTNLLRSCIDSLKKQQACQISVFDKSVDDLVPESQFINVTGAFDILIIEGWCVGISAQNNKDLLHSVNHLEKEEDASGRWRHYVNNALATEYQSVFSEIDYLVMLQAPSFSSVFEWRLQQETKLIEKLKKKGLPLSKTMSRSEISRFIQHYQRLTEHALATLPASANALLTLNNKREIIKCRMT